MTIFILFLIYYNPSKQHLTKYSNYNTINIVYIYFITSKNKTIKTIQLNQIKHSSIHQERVD